MADTSTLYITGCPNCGQASEVQVPATDDEVVMDQQMVDVVCPKCGWQRQVEPAVLEYAAERVNNGLGDWWYCPRCNTYGGGKYNRFTYLGRDPHTRDWMLRATKATREKHAVPEHPCRPLWDDV